MNATRKRVAPLALALVLTLALSALGLLAPGASAAEAYKVTIGSMSYGKVTADKDSADKGGKVTLTITPDDGYELNTLSVDRDGGGTQQRIANNRAKNGRRGQPESHSGPWV